MFTRTHHLLAILLCLLYLTHKTWSNESLGYNELDSDSDNVGNIWEQSGFFEGDIILQESKSSRNGMLNDTYYWPDSLVPFQIDENYFSECSKFKKILLIVITN